MPILLNYYQFGIAINLAVLYTIPHANHVTLGKGLQ